MREKFNFGGKKVFVALITAKIIADICVPTRRVISSKVLNYIGAVKVHNPYQYIYTVHVKYCAKIILLGWFYKRKTALRFALTSKNNHFKTGGKLNLLCFSGYVKLPPSFDILSLN